MKVEMIEDGLMIISETEFEEEYIKSFMLEKLDAFVKTGVTGSDIVGLKIRKEKRI